MMDYDDDFSGSSDDTNSSSSQEVQDISALVEEKNVPASKLAVTIKKMNEKNGYHKEFKELNKIEDNTDYSDYSEATKWENKSKNRYINVLPLNTTRVALTKIENVDSSDYINANYIHGFREREYIATQGPLKETVMDFWRMVYEQNCTVIVMLTKLVEDDKIKCYRYWPREKTSKSLNYFKLTNQKKEKDGDITVTTILLENTKTNDKRTITHFQYKEWPDHGLPSSASTFRHLLRLVDKMDQKKSPIITHCSAGLGRTGTFCIVHTIIERTEYFIKTNPNKEPIFNIFKAVLEMRNQRTGSVQTEEQYEFCYKAIAEEYSSFNKK